MGEAHFNLAAIYQGEGHLDKALTQYLHLYEHKPDFPQLDLAIASIYIQLNKNEKYHPSKLDFYLINCKKICDLDLTNFNSENEK